SLLRRFIGDHEFAEVLTRSRADERGQNKGDTHGQSVYYFCPPVAHAPRSLYNQTDMRTLMIVLAASLAMAQQNRPEWAFPVADKVQPNVPESSEARKMPGSTKSYTPAQIDDLSNPPDWFPDEHGALPQIVQKGNGAVLACGACHLMS